MKKGVFLLSVFATTLTSGQLKAQNKPTVAIIGTGNLAVALGPALGKSGYSVVYGSREPARDVVRKLVQLSGPRASAVSPREAAAKAQVIILAVPGEAPQDDGLRADLPYCYLETTGRVTGIEVGGLLGFLAGKVLGQFDPFFEPHGRLLLVAPNIVHVERELDVDPHDFRLWVCLHEETHRVQFTAVPWMRDHLFSEIASISDTVSPSTLLEGGLERLTDAIKAGREGGSIVDMFSTPEQRAVIDRVTGMMSLLEGHADVVMDDVGPTVIPTVAAIRKKFTVRRKGMGTLDRVLRRLLGLEAKMAQYRDGAKFVRAVVDKVGMEEFNAVWAGPENLPSKAELADPDGWVTRVLG